MPQWRDVMVKALAGALGVSEEEIRKRADPVWDVLDASDKKAMSEEVDDATAEKIVKRYVSDPRLIAALKGLSTTQIDGRMIAPMAMSLDPREREFAKLQNRRNQLNAKKHIESCLSGRPIIPIGREELTNMARLMWELMGPWNDDDDDVAIIERLETSLDTMPDSEKKRMLVAGLAAEDFQAWQIEMGRWYRHGMPLIQTSHTYATALMATSVPHEMVEFIRAPWPVFIIELPSGLLSTADASGKEEELGWLLVAYHEPLLRHPNLAKRQCPRWNMLAIGRRTILLSSLWKTSLADDPGHREIGPWSMGIPLNNRDDRTLILLSRLAAGSCLAMSDPNNLKRYTSKRGVGKGHHHEFPDVMRFKLGQPLRVDCRQALQDYIEHGGTTPGVRVLVRGHWKNQACGPLFSQRKLIWVQPYWRGPDDAPILLRPHQIGTS